MSLNHKHRWWLAIAVAGLSCGIPRTHYYTMELAHVAQTQGAAIDRSITIPRFRADHVLMDDRILYREGPDEVNFYEYHRWASPPADLATNYFVHRLKDSGTYARVSGYSEGASSDLTLRGQLHRFEEVDRGKEVFASVALELELSEARTRTSVWRGEAECTRPLATKDIAGVVRGLHECLDETASKLLSSMQQQIESARQHNQSR
jgi:ABC-type uncharacterized transport system auxiliary subunit